MRNTFISFDSKRDQHKIDALYRSINEVKSSLKQSLSGWFLLDGQHYFGGLGACKSNYYDKKRRYETVLNKTIIDLRNAYQYESAKAAQAVSGSQKGFKAIYCALEFMLQKPANVQFIQEKRRLLGELVETADRLRVVDDKELEIYFQELELKLAHYLSREDRFFIYDQGCWQQLRSELKAELKQLRKLLRTYVQSFKLRFRRNIRHFYRTIIRFLFKNMDDQSGDSDTLLHRMANNLFAHSLTGLIHEQTRNHRTVTNYIKYQ